MIDKILNFWYALELFQPNWPVKEGEGEKIGDDSLPWGCSESNPDVQIYYDVYVGKATIGDLTDWLLDSLGHPDEKPIEKNYSPSCLFALKLTDDGMYYPGSFSVSGFAWAVGNMAKDKNVDLSEESLKLFQESWDELLLSKETVFALQDLEELFSQICDEASFTRAGLFSCEKWVKKRVYEREEGGDFPEIDSFTELMQSFYISDIIRIMDSPGSLVPNYGQALTSNSRNQYEIDTDHTVMEEWLEAECFPCGAWPSVHSPSLMQQLAINLSISDQKMVAVNGPPGTGKTTLLKEVIASNIVERALLLSEYSSPDDAFRRKDFIDPPDKYNRTYYVPDSKLTAFGVIVASNNNAAVENISIELPKTISKDRTGLFSQTTSLEDGYFSDAATKLLGEPAWGLISAKLGRGRNIKTFIAKLWPENGSGALKKYFDKDYPKPDWDTACSNFRTAYEKVQKVCREIAYAQKLLPQENRILKELKSNEEQLVHLLNEHSCIQKSLADKKHTVSLMEEDCQRLTRNIEQLQQNLSLLTRIFRPLLQKNQSLQDLQKLKDKQSELIVSMENTRTKIRTTETMSKNLEAQVDVLKSQINKAEAMRDTLQNELEQYKQIFKGNFVHDSFWTNIAHNHNSQKSCPWTYYEYDKMREELFYQALMLHKAFAINSNSVGQNLKRLMKMWDGKFKSTKDRQAAFSSLLNTLQLVIPVISTTFASVKSFLSDVGSEELGVLVVDEAGQATPQSALGAIWRTRRAIVVGDPLQVEPILSTPQILIRHFAKKNQLPPEYHFGELSVQKFADAQSSYGGFRKVDDEKIWLGCPLIVHRRCIEPMFSISNKSAYNERMLCETAPPEEERVFLLKKSCWFNIQGTAKGNKDHSVKEQTEFVSEMIKQATEIYKGLPPIYIITPFTTVKNALHRELKKVLKSTLSMAPEKSINDWLNNHCGTVHTFQGKEADEVFLVLGCDKASSKGAARWVGQKPNLINVAVSRAKYRLAIIGDFDLWSKVNFVSIACEHLDRENEVPF